VTRTVYVFALTSHAIPSFALKRRRVDFLDLGGFHAAVERRSQSPAVSESSLRTQHDIVTRLANRIDAIIPARFGAVIDERDLRDILEARRPVIQDALALVRGRVQMTVRFRDASESMPRNSPPIPAGMTGTAYLEARRSAIRMMPALAGVVATAVANLTIAERSEAQTERAPAVLYHLIARENVARYKDVVSSLNSAAVSVSGPWPPFAFAPDIWP
jgi:hypothetical protein